MRKLVKLEEPCLLFGHNQAVEDPRDGLTLFGPLDEGKPFGIRAGVIGTKDGIRRYKNWAESIQRPIANDPPQLARPPFPGFEAVFQIPWHPNPTLEIEILRRDLDSCLHIDDQHQRVYKTVDLYEKRITASIRQEESKVDVWFVIIPDDVHKYCRPQSYLEPDLRIEAASKMPIRAAKNLLINPSLFEKENTAAVPYHYELDFHNQLKGRLLQHDAPIQIVRESTIAYQDFVDPFGNPKRDLKNQLSAIAWNLATTAFYKAGGRPWKLGSIRDGVCYVGLVFKQDERGADPRSSCCAAQMFLDSGDGVVFKGALGPWHVPGRGEFHLTRHAARQLMDLALKSYNEKKGSAPKELFIHGKIRFDNEEWKGFCDAVDSSTRLVGVRIRDESDFKLYRKGKHPVLRGLAYIRDARTAYLWTKGFTPRLQTYPGREVPRPVLIDVCRGDADIQTVLNDIMALTKLNYNACIFADGYPVTLKFADAVGEILTAGPFDKIPPLPFRYYI